MNELGEVAPAPDTAPRYWTPLRELVARWLETIAPSLAELYRGALDLLHGTVPGRSRLICHAVREIRNRLPDALVGEERGRTEYRQLTVKIAKEWEKAGLSSEALTPPIPESSGKASGLPESLPVPRRLLEAVAELLRDHDAGSGRAQRRFERLFEALSSQNAAQRAEMTPVVSQWRKVTTWFEFRAHDNGRTDSDYDWQQMEEQFGLFEASLSAFATGFFAGLEEVNALLDEANS